MNYEMNHPLKVYHPGRGIHYVCRWWTYNEKHQIIIATSQKAVKQIWETACQRYSDAEAKEFCEVELVAPSALMCSKAIAYKRDADIDDFINEVTGKINESIKLGLNVPKLFEPCVNFESYYKDDYEPDSSTLEYHFDCQNCTNRLKLIDMTYEQFFDKFHQLWNEGLFIKERVGNRNKTVYSTANPAADDEVIWEASYRSGVDLFKCQVGEPPWQGAYPRGHFHEVLFYFRMLKEIDISSFDTKEFRIKQEKIYEEEKQLLIVSERMQQLEAAKKMLAIFQ